MIVVVENGERPIRKSELVACAIYMAESAEKAKTVALREARLEAARAYATEALRGFPSVRPGRV